MPTLRIYLLGDFHLMLDDKSITSIIPPRAQLLLAYLALHSQTPLSRQHLAFLFWPDSTERQARNNLRQLLHLLRTTLPHSKEFFRSDAQTVQWLHDSSFTLDVNEFEQAIAQADTLEALRQALSLYNGELLLGCYAEWVLSERERLRLKFVQVLEQLVLWLERERDFRSAIRYGEHLLRYDPLREESYRQLIRLHGLNGNSAEARRVYQSCVAVLKRELDVAPSAETRATYDQTQTETASKPPVLTPARRQTTNLPTYLTSFVGRKEELKHLKSFFPSPSNSKTRLLTLTGTGGCGKTRLALQLANELISTFVDGVWFINLAPVTDPALIPQTIAAVLGVREQSDRALLDTLTGYLRSKELLLIFDNCEHLVDACRQVVDSLLGACLGLQILATSRERLDILGEVVWRVPSLSLPDSNHEALPTLVGSDAIQLFVERTCAVLPTFTLNAVNAPAVLQICQRLDGIPLAIELATARISVLTPNQIASRLDDAFQLLTQSGFSGLPRHQTLRATMDWSHLLLSKEEQVLFRRLAVFAGSFTLEAVEAVCSENEQGPILAVEVLDLLSKLTDKSLVNVTDWQQEEQARYRLLEPIWQYANEKLLESGEWEQFGARHLAFFLNLAEEAEPHLSHTEQVMWFNGLVADHNNLMSALDWSLKHGELVSALRLTGTLWYFWVGRGYYSEGMRRLVQALSLTTGAAPSAARAKALWAAGAISLWAEGDWSRARPFLEEAVATSRELGNKRILAGALGELGETAFCQGDHIAARAFLGESLALLRELDDQHSTGWSLTYLGDVSRAQHDDEQAQRLYAEGLAQFRAIGDINSAGYAIRRLGALALNWGEYQRAGELFKESLGLNKTMDYPKGIAACLQALAALASTQGQPIRAARLLGASEALLNAAAGKPFLTDQAEYGHTVTALRAQLDEASLNSACAEGRAMKMEEAIDFAMKADEH